MKTKTLKLISKALLVIILATSVLSLYSCNFPQRGWFNAGGHFYTFKEAEEYINNAPKDGNTFILFDLDDEESVEKISYEISALGIRRNKKLVYSWSILRGTFYATKGTEDSKYRIDYQFRMWGIDVANDAEFEIRLLEPLNDDIMADIMYLQEIYKNRDLGDINYSQWLTYGLYADGKIIMEIVLSVPLLQDGNYEEYYSDVCDMLLENLVVIK